MFLNGVGDQLYLFMIVGSGRDQHDQNRTTLCPCFTCILKVALDGSRNLKNDSDIN